MLKSDQLSDLRSRLTGRVIAPGEAGYDEARTLFYGGFDHRPAMIARVANAADVAGVIAFARQTGLELAVRSGGHSVAGHSVCEGGLVLDLGDMKALEIDVERRTAWAEAGLTAAEYAAQTGAGRPGYRLRRYRLGGDWWDHARRRRRVSGAQIRTDDR